jgi:hypothetical protein
MALIAAAMEVRYREICRRLIAREKPPQIAEALSITPGTLYVHMRKESFRTMLRAMDKEIFAEIDELLGESTTDIQTRIKDVQNEAFDKLVHVMRYGTSEKTQLRASTEILNRGGTVATQAPNAHVIELPAMTAKMLVLAMIESAVADKRLEEAERPAIEAEAKSA